MRYFLNLSLVCAALAVLSSSRAAAAPLVVNIDNPNFRKLVVAIPDFKLPLDADDQLKRLAKEGPEELGRLLNFSGLFNIMANAGFQEIMTKQAQQPIGSLAPSGLEGIDLPSWKAIGVESLTVGELSREAPKELTIALRTIDINQGKLILGKKYSKVAPEQFKKVMAKYADRLLEAYTGKAGIFSSKLVFVGRANKGQAKQIYISDFDGADAHPITTGAAPHLSPAWSRDGKYVTYTTFEDGGADLAIYEVSSGKKRKLSASKGVDSGSNWSGNGKLVAFSIMQEGEADIFTVLPDGSKSKALIRGSGLDVDPTFSPDGKMMAFVSGRFGNPHIFVADLKWDGDTSVRVTGDKRLTYAGWYNATPSWSPDSDKIAFAGYDRDTDRFDLFMVNPDGTNMERLTIRAGDNERPSWSPNGQMIVYHSNRTQGRDVKSVAQLYVMNRDGSAQRQLATGLYESQTPQWGPPQE